MTISDRIASAQADETAGLLSDRCEVAMDRKYYSADQAALRALNREFALAVGWVRKTPREAGRKHPAWFHPDDCRGGHVVMDSLHGTDVWREPLNYVQSIDAALTLLPDEATGWSINVDKGLHQALIFRDGDGVIGRGDASSPALALAAAIARSRNLP